MININNFNYLVCLLLNMVNMVVISMVIIMVIIMAINMVIIMAINMFIVIMVVNIHFKINLVILIYLYEPAF